MLLTFHLPLADCYDPSLDYGAGVNQLNSMRSFRRCERMKIAARFPRSFTCRYATP